MAPDEPHDEPTQGDVQAQKPDELTGETGDEGEEYERIVRAVTQIIKPMVKETVAEKIKTALAKIQSIQQTQNTRLAEIANPT